MLSLAKNPARSANRPAVAQFQICIQRPYSVAFHSLTTYYIRAVKISNTRSLGRILYACRAEIECGVQADDEVASNLIIETAFDGAERTGLARVIVIPAVEQRSAFARRMFNSSALKIPSPSPMLT